MTRWRGESAEAVKALGYRDDHAAWIALAALVSGIFTRRQHRAFAHCSEASSRRLVARLLDAGIARDVPLSPARGGASEYGCQLTSRRLYRALGLENIRHRRHGSPGILYRRLLHLDHVIDNPSLPWLVTETEKVDALTSAGLSPEALPHRDYPGRHATTRRHFAIKAPIALTDDGLALLYAVAGSKDLRAIDYWCQTQADFWRALHQAGLRIHVAAVARTEFLAAQTEQALQRWTGSGQLISPRNARIAAAIESAAEREDWDTIHKHGGAQAAAEFLGRVKSATARTGDRVLVDSHCVTVADRLSPDTIA